ncbi:MAG: metallophosphoesterase [Candidatus Zipacnadales bacterium]
MSRFYDAWEKWLSRCHYSFRVVLGLLALFAVFSAVVGALPPEQVLLTWAGDPTQSISVQWSTSQRVSQGIVAYMPRASYYSGSTAHWDFARAVCEPLGGCAGLNWHTARLTGLRPGTEYVYLLGEGSGEGWSRPRTFRTAPAGRECFCFIYMGDAQEGLAAWGNRLKSALRLRPDSAFFLMAGDLVDRGSDLGNWFQFLQHGTDVFSQRPLMPCLGNHECMVTGKPEIYLRLFDLPRNGPSGIEAERVYCFSYGNALFLILDSNLKAQSQVAWLEQQLAASTATWKFVMFHHPAYSSDPTQDHVALRNAWVPIFDRYHVDVVFQGHDHAYLRTYPLRAGRRVARPAEGTIYIISVSGAKMYKQVQRSYTEVGFTNTATYSAIDLVPNTDGRSDWLIYKAYDSWGRIRDQFTIQK